MSIFSSVFAVLLSLVSVTSEKAYQSIFIFVYIFGLLAVGGAAYLYFAKSRLFFVALLSGVFAIYAVVDVILRQVTNSRLLDFFR
jgi:hypothetical protein